MGAASSRDVTLLRAADAPGNQRLRVFCFPHAGSGVAAYRAWRPHLPAHVELALVHLPGREQRIRDPPLASMDAMLEHLDNTLQPFLEAPYAFFGHSFGAMVAHELAHRLLDRGGTLPVHLIASGCPAPHLPDPLDALRALPDHALVTRLAELGGTPPDLLRHEELMALVLPVLRADLAVLATRTRRAPIKLPMPVTALAGEEDPIAPPHAVKAWQEHAETFHLRVVPGGHFFLHGALDEVARALARGSGSRDAPIEP